jgi:ATP synthase protein I
MTPPDSNANPPKSDPKSARSGGLDTLVKAERLTQIAFVLPTALIIGWGLGALLDRWLHQHWIYIVGLIFGAVAGMFEAVRLALRGNGK